MGNFHKKVNFERKVLQLVNDKVKVKNELVSLSRNSIDQWAEEYKELIDTVFLSVVINISKEFGFIKSESISFLDFNYDDETLEDIKCKINSYTK